jgi:branched-chain amino acid transport system substrate-binding protein
VRLARARLGACVAAVLAVAALLALSACGSSSKDGQDTSGTAAAASTTAATTASADALKCGDGSGQKATGTPLEFGSILVEFPGLDLSGSQKSLQALWDCINDNGGIKGHPLKLNVVSEPLNPQQAHSAAVKLLDQQKVLGMVGSLDNLDCTVNGDYYAQKNIYAIGVGLTKDCFTIPNFASVSSGPAGNEMATADGCAQKTRSSWYGVNTAGPGNAFYNEAGEAQAKASGIEQVGSTLVTVPINDPSGLALQLASKSKDGGCISMLIDPASMVKVLNAAAQQGLAQKYLWQCAGLCLNSEVAKTVDPRYDSNLTVMQDTALWTSDSPGAQQYRQVMEKYFPDEPLSALGLYGYTIAKIASDELAKLPEDQLTREGINQAFHDIKDAGTGDVLCDGWTYGDGKGHFPVTSYRQFTVKDKEFEEQGSCTAFDQQLLTQLGIGG